MYDSSGDFVLRSFTQDKDIVFKGNDGGSIIDALKLDMSEAGDAKMLVIVILHYMTTSTVFWSRFRFNYI